MKRLFFITITCLTLFSLAVSSCAREEVKQLEGIIQQLDTENGEITIVTKDGQTLTLKIDTETSVEAKGESSTLDTLEAGVPIQVEITEDDQVVKHIEANQSEVEEDEDVAVDSETEEAADSTEDAVTEEGTDSAVDAVTEEATDSTEEEQETDSQEPETAEDTNGMGTDDSNSHEEEPSVFEGTIEAINGNLWTIIVDGKTYIVDVSKVEISAEPVIGQKVIITGTLSEGTIIASETDLSESSSDSTDSSDGDHPEEEGDHPEEGGDHPEDDYPEEEGDHPEDDH